MARVSMRVYRPARRPVCLVLRRRHHRSRCRCLQLRANNPVDGPVGVACCAHLLAAEKLE